MGETQLYSQRLHGINEKRRILSEVDRVQRELEQQKVKLHQLKRKSLRDRWLMDGLVPTAGVELENPLSETEGEIKQLELQLESLQSELLYLENPELRALKAVKDQGVTLQKELVNGERNLQQVDQNENLKKHPITEEADQPGDSQEEKHAVSQKDVAPSTEVVAKHPVPAPRGTKVSKNHEVEHNLDLQPSNEHKPDNQIYQSQNVKSSVQIDKDGGHEEIQNPPHNKELPDTKEEHHAQDGTPQEPSPDGYTKKEHQVQDWTPPEPSPHGDTKKEHQDGTPQGPSPDGYTKEEHQVQDGTPQEPIPDGDTKKEHQDGTPQEPRPDGNTKKEHKAQDGTPGEPRPDGDTIDKIQSFPNQKLGSLENTLEQEDQNLRSSSNELESVDQKSDDSQPNSGNEDLNNDLFKQNQNDQESLLDEITKLVNLREQEDHHQHQGGKPHLSTEQLTSESLLTHNNEESGQNLEESKVSVLVSHEGHNSEEELALSLETERAHPVVFNNQEEKEKTVSIENETPDQGSLLHSDDQTLENAQRSVLPPSDQEVCTTLPCTDQVPSQLPTSGGQNEVGQVHISEVLVVSPSGREPHYSSSAQGPSASQQPGAKETSTAPESQPLLKKSQETDANHGANTAETRDKSTPTKKKTCQCCVLM